MNSKHEKILLKKNEALEKELAAKHRQLEIEAALERARSVAMGMKQPGDILDVCKAMFTELQAIGFSDVRNAIINFWDDEHKTLIDYDYSDFAGPHISKLSYSNNHPAFQQFQQTLRSAQDSFVELIISGNDLQTWKERRKADGEYEDPRLENVSALYYYFYSIGVGAIGISTFKPITDEQLSIVKRFRNVFDLAYRRYVDITIAEAQAREAKIEAALEKVRSRTMAMQRSDELMETAVVLFDQLNQLGENIERTIIGVMNEEEGVFDIWATRPDGSQMEKMQKFPIDEPIVMQKIYDAWRQQKKSIVIDLQGQELESYFQFLKSRGPRLKRESFGDRRVENFAFFSKGMLGVISADPKTPGNLELYERFAGVFDLTYTRFLDLQKAEAQTREAKIEAALERVRAKAMAMHSSEDLAETIKVFYQQMGLLNLLPRRCGVGLIDKETRIADLTGMVISENGETKEIAGKLKLATHPVLEKVYDHWLLQKEYHHVLRGNRIKEYYQLIGSSISFQNYPDDAIQFGCFFFFPEGVVYAWTEKEFTEDQLEIYRRFTSVLSLTYKRYKDLQRAEAQAREAQIEAALERVRAAAMAMHKSEDLNAAVAVVFEELKKLNLGVLRCGINVLDKEKRTGDVWVTSITDQGSA
ncbi:MAG: hypothetical protein ICV66_11445, partial [Chitinophagaceae bacterium]|nr:hypothetical protein [Chitinophagaceae bacterium]